MSSQTVARRYATALADVVAGKVGARAVQEELVGWELMINSNSQLKEVFANPTVPYDQKRKVLRELITRTKVGPLTSNFLEILLKNQRVTALEEINRRLAEVLDARSGVLAAHVTTARPISDDARKALSEKLSRMSGKQVRLSFTTDQSLIGGMVTRVGSTVYDGSIRSQLNRMEKSLAGDQ